NTDSTDTQFSMHPGGYWTTIASQHVEYEIRQRTTDWWSVRMKLAHVARFINRYGYGCLGRTIGVAKISIIGPPNSDVSGALFANRRNVFELGKFGSR